MPILNFEEKNLPEIAALMDNGTDIEELEEILTSDILSKKNRVFVKSNDLWMFASAELIEDLLYAAIKLKEE